MSAILYLVRGTLNGTARIAPKWAGKLAYRVMATPIRGKASDAGRQFLNTAQEEDIPLGQEKVHVYHWAGKGPRVLLAHGWESNPARWQPLVEKLLAAGHGVLALDAPAHGKSTGATFNALDYARYMQAALEKYPVDVLVGHSAGGMASIYYLSHLAEDQSKTKQLIILATPSELSQLIALYRKILGVDERVGEALEQTIQERFNWPSSYFSMATFAKQLKVPGLILHDRSDPVAPFAGAEAIHANWSQSELIAFDGKDHSLFDTEIVKLLMNRIIGR